MTKKNKLYKSISLLVLVALCFGFFPDILYAAEKPLCRYEEKLVEINERLGTNYKIASEKELEGTGMTYQELLDFYTKMSLSEFEEYILELHSQNIQFDDSVSRIEYDNINTNGLARGSSRVSQYYYYPTGSNNYIGLTTCNIIIGGTSYYQSVYRYEVSQAFSYPYFKPVSYSYTPSSDSRQLTCTFECNKHISATVIQTGIFRLTTTFTAQGGGTITTNNFSTAGAVNDSGVRLRNYPNTTSTILELMYFPEDVLIDTANSTMTFYRVKREVTGTVGYVSKEYINRAQVASE